MLFTAEGPAPGGDVTSTMAAHRRAAAPSRCSRQGKDKGNGMPQTRPLGAGSLHVSRVGERESRCECYSVD